MVGASVYLSAQEKGKAEGKAYTVETSRFGTSWFISGGVGGQVYFGGNDGKADFERRIVPTLDVAVGRWFTPDIGLHVAYNGLQVKGTTLGANDLYTKGGKYSNGYYKQKWNVASFHGDALFNLSNTLCGYNEDRLYPFIPYVGAGVVLSWSEPHQQNLGINAGSINCFRVSDAQDINLELRGLLMKDAFSGTSKEGMAGVTVDVIYEFKKRGFSVVPATPMVPESQLDDMRNGLNSLKGESESLKRNLIKTRSRKPEVAVKEGGRFVPRLVVVLNIGKSNVSKGGYVNIRAVAKGIKVNPEKTLTVIGYANKGTGSAEYSIKLSKKRIEVVHDLMVNEFDVSTSQLKVDYKGGVGSMFYDDAKLNRVVIVEE